MRCIISSRSGRDRAAGARKRQCQQLAILFQDLSVNFHWDAPYRKLFDECERSGRASLPCDGAEAIKKRMRCMLAMIVGGDTTECMGPVPHLPPFPPRTGK